MVKQKTTFGLIACIIFLLLPVGFAQTGWQYADEIRSRINAPTFSDKDFNIVDFGAVADGNDCTEAIKNAITAAYEAGGGRVVVPAGQFSSGAIHLKSNVELHLAEGAVIKFSTDPNSYLPTVYTRWEGVECMNYSPMVYAYEQNNIAITGKGTLDAQSSSENWWAWSKIQKADRERLFKYGQEGAPVQERKFGAGAKLRPNMIQFYKCKNILIEGVTIKDSPMWHIHPVLSYNITVKNVKITGYGPNNDGFNPESCKNIIIENCYFDTGDDCIAVKAGRNDDGRRVDVPSEDIIIRNCRMMDGHGGVVIGSEMTGGVRNVFVEDCMMDSPNLERAFRIKTNAVRGGFIENLYVRNIAIGRVHEAVLKINMFYEEGDVGEFAPVIRNINIENVTCGKSEYALYLKGYQRSPIKDVRLKNCVFENIEKSSIIENVEGLVFENVIINGELSEINLAEGDNK
ncbi:MAG: glycoside hydrolase family 28 protein [Phycisphaerae bacterium]|jgi:polygalacturonase